MPWECMKGCHTQLEFAVQQIVVCRQSTTSKFKAEDEGLDTPLETGEALESYTDGKPQCTVCFRYVEWVLPPKKDQKK